MKSFWTPERVQRFNGGYVSAYLDHLNTEDDYETARDTMDEIAPSEQWLDGAGYHLVEDVPNIRWAGGPMKRRKGKKRC